MLDLTTKFGEIGASIEKAIKEHTEKLKESRALYADHQTQLSVMNISLNAVRNEVLERIDTSERKMLEESGKIQAQLQSLASLITNRNGGHHD